MLESFLLVVALCMDAFMASLAYGAGNIKIPFRSAFVIGLIGTSFLALSLFAAGIVARFVPAYICALASFILLMVLGVSSLFQNAIKAYLKTLKNNSKKLSFKYANIGFIIDIYLDETQADSDRSKVLSVKEAVYLAVVLSMDSLVTGFGAGLGAMSYVSTLAMSLVLGVLAVMLGGRIGAKIAGRKGLDLSWMGGAILILLAVVRMI